MKMRKQRLMGLALVVISGILLALASTGTTPEDQDATAILMTLPLGLYMIFGKTYILYDGEPEAKARDEPEIRPRASPPSTLHIPQSRKEPHHAEKKIG